MAQSIDNHPLDWDTLLENFRSRASAMTSPSSRSRYLNAINSLHSSLFTLHSSEGSSSLHSSLFTLHPSEGSSSLHSSLFTLNPSLVQCIINYALNGSSLKSTLLNLDILSSLYNQAAKDGLTPLPNPFAILKTRLKDLGESGWKGAIDDQVFERALRLTKNAHYTVGDDSVAADMVLLSLINGCMSLGEIATLTRADIERLDPESQVICRRQLGNSRRKYIFPLRQSESTPRQISLEQQRLIKALFRRARLPQADNVFDTICSLWAYAALRCGIAPESILASLPRIPLGLPILSLLSDNGQRTTDNAECRDMSPTCPPRLPSENGKRNSENAECRDMSPTCPHRLPSELGTRNSDNAECRDMSPTCPPRLPSENGTRNSDNAECRDMSPTCPPRLPSENAKRTTDNVQLEARRADNLVNPRLQPGDSHPKKSATPEGSNNSKFQIPNSKLTEALHPSPSTLHSSAEAVAAIFLTNPLRWFALSMRPHVRFEQLHARISSLYSSHSSEAAGSHSSLFTLHSSSGSLRETPPLLFYPCEEIAKVIKKKIIYKKKPFIRSVVFFQARITDIPRLIAKIGDLAWCYRQSGAEGAPYAEIDPRQFDLFQQTISSFTPNYEVAESGTLQLKKNDRVRIVGGLFTGLEATFDSSVKAEEGVVYRLNIVGENGFEWRIAVDNRLTTSPFTLHP